MVKFEDALRPSLALPTCTERRPLDPSEALDRVHRAAQLASALTIPWPRGAVHHDTRRRCPARAAGTHMAPQWRAEYLDYHALKKLLPVRGRSHVNAAVPLHCRTLGPEPVRAAAPTAWLDRGARATDTKHADSRSLSRRTSAHHSRRRQTSVTSMTCASAPTKTPENDIITHEYLSLTVARGLLPCKLVAPCMRAQHRSLTRTRPVNLLGTILAFRARAVVRQAASNFMDADTTDTRWSVLFISRF